MIIFGSYFLIVAYVMGIAAYSISDEDKETFLKEILDLHNQKRIIHGVDPLSWNTDMVADANNILKLFNPKVPLPPNPKYAINTYHEEFEDDFKLDAAAVFNSWYNTRIHYDYDNPKQSKKTDPFTQIVWASTKLLSLALSVDEDHYKVVVLYYPRSNSLQTFKMNVQRPSSSSEMPFDPLNKSVK